MGRIGRFSDKIGVWNAVASRLRYFIATKLGLFLVYLSRNATSVKTFSDMV
jgi:hypothetical protein